MRKRNIVLKLFAAAAVLMAASCTKTVPYCPPGNDSVISGAKERGYYEDGDCIVLKESANKGNPIVVVILPDGFTRGDLTVGGAFESRARTACDALFDIEPMRSLSPYIKVVAEFYASEDDGVAVGDVRKDTRFSVSRDESEDALYVFDEAAVNECVSKIAADRYNIFPVVLAKDTHNRAAARFVFRSGGKLACTCIVPSSCKSEASFRGMMRHECCGHAIGALDDEYAEKGKVLTDSDLNFLKKGFGFGYFRNVSLSNSESPWDKYIGLPGYEGVSYYEGACGFEKGVFRSEESSIMKRSLEGRFNAISRESIYKRVMELSGNEYSWEEFLELDKNWK